jgi:hypothetical protein
MGLYDGEPWAELAKRAGHNPENVETQAREAFRFCAKLLAEEHFKNKQLRREREDLRVFAKGIANNIIKMLET